MKEQYRFQYMQCFTKERKNGSRGAEKKATLLVIYSVFQYTDTRRHLYLHPITEGKCTYKNPHLKEYVAKQKMKVNSEDYFLSYLYSDLLSLNEWE